MSHYQQPPPCKMLQIKNSIFAKNKMKVIQMKTHPKSNNGKHFQTSKPWKKDKYKRLWGENKLFTKTGKRLFDIANANEIEYETKCALEKRNTEKKALLPGYIEHADKDLLLPFSVVLNIT